MFIAVVPVFKVLFAIFVNRNPPSDVSPPARIVDSLKLEIYVSVNSHDGIISERAALLIRFQRGAFVSILYSNPRELVVPVGHVITIPSCCA